MSRVPQRPSAKVSSVTRFPLRSARDTSPSIVAVAPSQSAMPRVAVGQVLDDLQRMYRAPPGPSARPVEVLDQSFIRSNDSLGRPPLYSPSLACRVVHIKPRYSPKKLNAKKKLALIQL
eukprot:scaffold59452_cov66-Phaeocystis_antarctica.AAC.1